MRMCGKRLERRPKPWIKKTFGSSSQNRYTSRFVRRRRHRLTDLVHFRFVQPFWLQQKIMDLTGNRKNHNSKKGPGKPPRIPNKNINTSTGQMASKKRRKSLRAAPPEIKARKTTQNQDQGITSKHNPTITSYIRPLNLHTRSKYHSALWTLSLVSQKGGLLP